MNVLLLGTENEMRGKLSGMFWRCGFVVDVAAPCDADAWLSASKPYALIVLDFAQPTVTSAAVHAVRRMANAPLLVLTERDRLEGIAPDTAEYLVKPFALGDLLTRAWALTSRGGGPDAALLRLADLAIDRARGKAFRQGTDLGLSATLFELLDVLMAHRGQVVSRARLLKTVWGSRASERDNVATLGILRLRHKLDDPFDLKLIHTVHRKGYVLECRSDR
jgi:two-component system copper resistance phosphate regulon response regulator CusR